MSHPVRVRGLKQGQMQQLDYMVKVAPRAGAWIETFFLKVFLLLKLRRTPCGCVD